MKEESIRAIENIIRSTPDDQLIPFREAYQVTAHILALSIQEEKTSVEKIIGLLKRRHVEDLITIRHLAPITAEILVKEKAITNYTDTDLSFRIIIAAELLQYPGGYLIHHIDELKPLILEIIWSNPQQEWYIYNYKAEALLLDVDEALMIFGYSALMMKDEKMEIQVHQKRSRLAMARKNKHHT